MSLLSLMFSLINVSKVWFAKEATSFPFRLFSSVSLQYLIVSPARSLRTGAVERFFCYWFELRGFKNTVKCILILAQIQALNPCFEMVLKTQAKLLVMNYTLRSSPLLICTSGLQVCKYLYTNKFICKNEFVLSGVRLHCGGCSCAL